MPSSQWTVSVTPTSAISVNNNTSTGIIGAVMPSTQWTVANATSTGIIGAVMPSTQWTVAIATSTGFIGNIGTTEVVATALDVATLFSSGISVTPSYANFSSTGTSVTLVTTTSAKITVLLSAVFSANTASTADITLQLQSSGGTAYSGKFCVRGSLGVPVVLPYNPIGWAQTTSSGQLVLAISAALAAPGVNGNITYVSI